MKALILTPATLALIATLILAATSAPTEAAGSETLTIGSVSTHVGEEGTVEVRALYLKPPGLGAWTFEVGHDPDLVSTVGCDGGDFGVCGPSFTNSTDRVAGASEHLLTGAATLAHFTYRCDREGESHLSLEVTVWGSAIPAPEEPQPDLEIVEGSIICEARDQATSTLRPTTTSVPLALPETGNAGTSSSTTWPIAAAAMLSVLALAAGARLARRSA